MDDPREAAAQYRLNKELREQGLVPETPDAANPDATSSDATSSDAASSDAAASARPPRSSTAGDRAAYVETAIQQAIRRGDFDDLPGAGKPLEGLGEHHDPDWWIRRKIETEQLRGLGPPALALRVEHDEFTARLDAITRESDVREYVEDFNRRVVEARRQLLGGPPVVTPTHDVDDEVTAWLSRRAARRDAELAARSATSPPRRRRTLWPRRPQP